MVLIAVFATAVSQRLKQELWKKPGDWPGNENCIFVMYKSLPDIYFCPMFNQKSVFS